MDLLFGQEHVKRYRETDGEEGHVWQRGSTVLLLTTTGRKSGEPRTTPLIYGRTNGEVMVVASKGGSPQPPAWYLNLKQEPEVEVQIKGDVFRARARDATPEEKPELWKTMTSQWPDYDAYQESTDREIPVVILERIQAREVLTFAGDKPAEAEVYFGWDLDARKDACEKRDHPPP